MMEARTSAVSGWTSERFRQNIGRLIVIILVTLGALVAIFPLWWMFNSSLKTRFTVIRFPPELIPVRSHWENYPEALTFMPFNIFFRNTFFYATVAVIGELFSSSLVAFGFARLRARYSNILFILVLSTMMLPYQVTMIPQYIMFSLLKWIDSYRPLLLPKFFGSAYLIFLLRQFYLGIPREMDEAAKIDGCSYLRLWWYITLPLSKSALVAVIIFSFMWHWNDYLGPLIYLNKETLLTVSIGLSWFTAAYGGTPWHLLMAASLVFTLPPLILFFFSQRYFIQGIVISGVKG